jgi:hypothetical protein
MTRLLKVLPLCVLCGVVLAPRPSFAQVSAADAAPFVGNWTLKFEGPMGPLEIKMKVMVDGGKVVGELTSDLLGTSKSTDATHGANGLTLKFTLDVQGMTLPSALTITPNGAAFKANFDIADGQFSLPGEAIKGT